MGLLQTAALPCCAAAGLRPVPEWDAGRSPCSVVLVGGCRVAGGGPVSGVVCVPWPRRAVGGTPSIRRVSLAPAFQRRGARSVWGRACALPVLGAGLPAPRGASALGRDSPLPERAWSLVPVAVGEGRAPWLPGCGPACKQAAGLGAFVLPSAGSLCWAPSPLVGSGPDLERRSPRRPWGAGPPCKSGPALWSPRALCGPGSGLSPL